MDTEGKVFWQRRVRFKKLHADAVKPSQSRDFDAGYDLCCLEDVELYSGIPVKIPTGIAMEIPEGYVGLVWDRSGNGSKGIKVLGGVIDSTYRGEILVCLVNTCFAKDIDGYQFNAYSKMKLPKGSKIAQILIQPVESILFEEVESLSTTDRGEKGFGSSDNVVD